MGELSTRKLTLGDVKAIAAFGTMLLLFGGMVASYWPLTIDDAYISARYAWNGANGVGLVFNPHEYVMGYTNFLLVLIESIVYAWGGDGIVAAKLIGVASAALILALTFALAYEIAPQRWQHVGAIAAILLILFPELALGAVMGLESSLFAFFFLAALWLYLHWIWRGRGGAGVFVILALLLWLATLTRPEGLGLAAFLGATHLVTTWWKGRLSPQISTSISHRASRWLRPFFWMALYALMLTPILLWLNHYYGSPIPNTFFAKTAAGIGWEKYPKGIAYIAQWVRETSLYWILPLAIWPFFQRQVDATVRIVALLTLYWLAYVTYTGGDWMPGFRFLLPVLPLIYLLAALGMVQVWALIQPGISHLSTRAQWLFALLALATLWMPAITVYNTRVTQAKELAFGYDVAHRQVAEWLEDFTPAKTKVAMMDIGMVGFYSERRILDITGLINREIASLMHADGGWIISSKPTAERIADYTLSHKPGVVILIQSSRIGTPFFSNRSHDAAIYEHPLFQQEYKMLFARSHNSQYSLAVFGRKELALAVPLPIVSKDTSATSSQATLVTLD